MTAESVVRALFREMNSRGIDYAVPRNYEGLPSKIGKDLDLIVRHRHLGALIRAATAAFQECGYSCSAIQMRKSGCSILGKPDERARDPSSKPMAIAIDASSYVTFHFGSRAISGLNYKVFAEDFEKQRSHRQGCEFTTLAPMDEFVALFRQWGFKEKTAYKAKLKQMLSDSPNLLEWYLKAVGLPCHEESVSLPEVNTKEYRKGLRAIAESRWGSQSIRRLLQCHFRVLAVHRTRGLIARSPAIYFTGPDGAGKTTLIEHLRNHLEEHGIRYKYFYSLKKFLRFATKYLVWIKKRRKSEKRRGSGVKDVVLRSEDSRDRDDGTRFWKWRRYVALLIGIADIVLGYAFSLYFRMRGQVVLVETSPYDIFVKYHMPRFPLTERILAPLIPQPTLGFLLKANPKDIHARKPELTIKELEDYYERMSEVMTRASVFRSYVEIDTGSRLESALRKVECEFDNLLPSH